jgi:hypothetical protein
MKRFLTVVLLFLVSAPAFARTDGRYFGFLGMIAITDRVAGQVTDDDPERLYAAMNVTPKDSNMGKGKAIKTADRAFTLVCTDRGTNGTICTLVIKAGAQGQVTPNSMRFTASGAQAAQLQAQFFSGASGQVEYATRDGSVRIVADGRTFLAEYRRP